MSPSFSPRSAKQTLKRARVFVWLGVLVALGYLMIRFESFSFPEGGRSPIDTIAPGDRLWIDRYPREPMHGDLFAYRDPRNGQLLLGRVGTPPDELEAAAVQRILGGAIWFETDQEKDSAIDSRVFGPVGVEQLAGRVLFVF